jgi:hypothetical protein
MIRLRRLRASIAVQTVLAAVLFAGVGDAAATRKHHRPHSHSRPQRHFTSAANAKRVCVYDHNSVSGLAAFAAKVGRTVIDCAMVYTGSPDWSGWVDPWFLHHPNPDLNWAKWVRQSPANDRRQLIISQPLIPSGLAGTDWRAHGAAGAYEGYARQFARTLVKDGVGDAIIRLSWEMNGTWNVDSIGSTHSQRAQ